MIVKTILTENPKTILEIGPGNYIVTNILSDLGFDVQTLDIDPDIAPDIVCDITNDNLPSITNKYDLVLAAEVLEHVEYKDSIKVLKNLKTITEKLLITVPCTNEGGAFFHFSLKLPGLSWLAFNKKFFYKPTKHVFNGQHYWELGKRKFSLNCFTRDIQNIGWSIDQSSINEKNTIHHLFLLTKNI